MCITRDYSDSMSDHGNTIPATMSWEYVISAAQVRARRPTWRARSCRRQAGSPRPPSLLPPLLLHVLLRLVGHQQPHPSAARRVRLRWRACAPPPAAIIALGYGLRVVGRPAMI